LREIELQRIFTVLALLVLAACSTDTSASIVGVWSVSEAVSGQVYELEFREDGAVRQVVQGQTHSGRYTFGEEDGIGKLMITWRNGSQSLNWVKTDGADSIVLFGDRADGNGDVVMASKRAALSLLE
jgi:hypothetical protein